MIKIIISDADLFAREGVKQMLSKHSDVHIVGEAQDFPGTLQCLRDHRPNVCLVEIALAGYYGLKLIRDLATHGAGTPILVMSDRTERDFALRAMRAGAAGFISKDCTDQQLAGAIRVASEHRPYVSETVSELIAESIIVGKTARGHQKLSDLEFEILCMLANGMPVSNVARMCDTSVSAVRARKNNIMEQLDLHSEVELVQYALKNQLIVSHIAVS